MPISSQATAVAVEGPETISKESTIQADRKRPTPTLWGDDIVQTSWKREAALKKLVVNIEISESGCWEWTGGKTVGYGTLKMQEIYGNFKILAHRLSYVAFKGESIKDGLFVCHKCDNPKCINPDHLFLGTQKQNLLDCSAKGRTLTGEKSATCKYSKSQILKVKELLESGKTGKEISKITGISTSHVCRIRKGYTWKHETATSEEMAHANRKYSDEQIAKVAELIADGVISSTEIAKISGVKRSLVVDMKRGKAHQRFMGRVTE